VASDDPDAAAASDAAIVVVGVTMEDEGEFLDLDAQVPLLERFAPPFADDGQRERFDYLVRHQEVLAEPPGGDRASLRLKPQDEALILEVAKRNPRTVVVLTGGSAFITEPWREQVGAILMAWYPGMEGGRALAEVICGACNPSGHMPFATPADEADLPPFPIVTDTVEYGALHGQWLFDATRARVRYPFGHGLSYAEFAPGGVDIGHDESGAWAEVVWRNRGSRAGRDVIQVYAVATADEARRRLIGFMPIGLAGGEDRSVRVPLDLRPLQKRDVGAWSWRDGAYRIEAARFSGDPDAATVAARLVDGRLSRWP
jgi:beta-glucosidase